MADSDGITPEFLEEAFKQGGGVLSDIVKKLDKDEDLGSFPNVEPAALIAMGYLVKSLDPYKGYRLGEENIEGLQSAFQKNQYRAIRNRVSKVKKEMESDIKDCFHYERPRWKFWKWNRLWEFGKKVGCETCEKYNGCRRLKEKAKKEKILGAIEVLAEKLI